MIIHKPHLCTIMPIWSPKYSTTHVENGEWVVLLHKKKVDHATAIIRIDFTKAKHLKGQRFAINQQHAKKYPVVSNGTADCYEVPFSELQRWDSAQEIRDKAFGLFDD